MSNWEPTCELRWIKRRRQLATAVLEETILQQKWVQKTDPQRKYWNEEWRDVPIGASDGWLEVEDES